MKLADFSPTQRRVIFILMLVNFVNYVDRQIIFSLFPAIRHDFGLSFEQLGYLATAFTVVLSVASFPLGMLADRVSKRTVISAGVLFWSAATFFSGLAGSFRSLLAARGLVGVGEAAYHPAGTAMISASFPGEIRARVQGAFDIGMFIGGAVGLALGGVMVQSFGWRPAFFLVGVPGLFLGLTALRLPGTPVISSRECMPLRELFRVPAFIALMLSGWFCSFAGYAYVAWGPDLVQEYKGFSAREAGTSIALAIVVGGTCGIATGAYLSDLMAKVRSWGRAAIVPVGFVLGAPPIYFALRSSSKLQFTFFFALGAFFLSWYHGPLTATIHDLVPPRPWDRPGFLQPLRKSLFNGTRASGHREIGRPLRPDRGPANTHRCATGRGRVVCCGDPVHPAEWSSSSGAGAPLARGIARRVASGASLRRRVPG